MFIQKIIRQRNLKRKARECLHHAKHHLYMREDLLTAEHVEATRSRIEKLQQCIRNKQWDAVESACEAAIQQTNTIKCSRVKSSLVENIEMLVVAIAVAMGLRAYFLQPFKIPTGSMQPTLNGITAVTTEPAWSDRQPFKIGRFLLRGEWHREVRAKASGELGKPIGEHPRDPSLILFRIAGQIHRIPRDVLVGDSAGNLLPPFHANRNVRQGEILWAGRTQMGDHLFVNKVIWNFRKPQRDEVMVFTTDNIHDLEPGTHYIKRMVGMPGERVSIRPPYLMVNGEPVSGYFGIDRVTAAIKGYDGFHLAGEMHAPQRVLQLDGKQYFALGDNTRNSRDSRYWGAVPRENLVGPAVFVYWPLTHRWGRIR
ncbi:MAG: signal peptidase I [Kiritimatiellia bacterium]